MSKVVSQNGRGRPRKYEYPAQLVCSVSGKIVKTNPTQMKNQLEKSGKTLEEYVKTYICRSARKQMKTGPKVEKVKSDIIDLTDPTIDEKDLVDDIDDNDEGEINAILNDSVDAQPKKRGRPAGSKNVTSVDSGVERVKEAWEKINN